MRSPLSCVWGAAQGCYSCCGQVKPGVALWKGTGHTVQTRWLLFDIWPRATFPPLSSVLLGPSRSRSWKNPYSAQVHTQANLTYSWHTVFCSRVIWKFVYLVPTSLLIQFEDWFVIKDLKDALKELVIQSQLFPTWVASILNAIKDIQLGQELSVPKVQRLLAVGHCHRETYH